MDSGKERVRPLGEPRASIIEFDKDLPVYGGAADTTRIQKRSNISGHEGLLIVRTHGGG